MDEILIEEKRYISSKRAAKVTGYAKDYVGQLCREGRVPARLVGRNWYVLETAIQDHRFGDSEIEQKKDTEVSHGQVFSSTWETPSYESASKEVLPSINRLRAEFSESVGNLKKESKSQQEDIQDSWREWLEHFDHIEDTVKSEPELEKEVVRDTEIVPIRTISRVVPSELLPQSTTKLELTIQKKREKPVKQKKGSAMPRTLRTCGILLALLAASVAVIGSGYFDKYILSNSQARIIAGVAVYNR
jgi:hypothetical protein